MFQVLNIQLMKICTKNSILFNIRVEIALSGVQLKSSIKLKLHSLNGICRAGIKTGSIKKILYITVVQH